MLNRAMLTVLGKSAELRLHVQGALNNGITAEEIRAILLHATVYCGIPAGLEAFRAAHGVLIEAGHAGPVDISHPGVPSVTRTLAAGGVTLIDAPVAGGSAVP